MKTILITGATGYIGSHLIAKLQQLGGNHIIGLSLDPPQQTPQGWQYVQGDVRMPNLKNRLLELQPDIVYNLAASPRT